LEWWVIGFATVGGWLKKMGDWLKILRQKWEKALTLQLQMEAKTIWETTITTNKTKNIKPKNERKR
jgi:hypothetical protein